MQPFATSPISPPGTTLSGTTTLINNTTTPMNKMSNTSSANTGIACASLPHLPYSHPAHKPHPNTVSAPINTNTSYKTRFRSGSGSDIPQHSSPWTAASAHHMQPQLSNQLASESIRASSRARRYLARVQTSFNRSTQHLYQQTQPYQPPEETYQLERQSSQGSRFRPSMENVRGLETVAQEYARTIKALWQMVEEEELSQRLADATPEEREWIIMHHSNQSETSTLASCYYIPNQLINATKEHFRYSHDSNASDDSRNSAAEPSSSSRSNSRLSYVADPVYNYNKNHFTKHSQSDHHQYQYQQPPLSPIRETHMAHSSHSPKSQTTATSRSPCRVHPDTQTSPSGKDKEADFFLDGTIQRRGTNVSDKAKLLQSNVTPRQVKSNITSKLASPTRPRHPYYYYHQQQQQQQQQSEHDSHYLVYHDGKFPEYEPAAHCTQYDLKEEIPDSDSEDIIQTVYFSKQEVDEDDDEDETYKDAAVLERSRRELANLEQHLGFLGLQRFDLNGSLYASDAHGAPFCEGDSLVYEEIAEPEYSDVVLGVAHKVGVRESRLFYHVRDGSRQIEVI
ncbi:hypothetical protein BGZ95_009232 [Linnemannia exigua]|uniref:Uncharacterized protein n=1 Tax=Linnemannia exigua TaxID=604196 RepID=A0AAD4DKQ9_9FUNG|nr:hypothetical protein BGZ95_009232 [Linnemannia exigua]